MTSIDKEKEHHKTFIADESSVARPWDEEKDPGEWDELKRHWLKAKKGVRVAYRTWSPLQWGQFFLPCLNWLPSYNLPFLMVRQSE